MIRWDLTESEFGYGEYGARSYSKIVVQCDECGRLNNVGFGGHKSLLSKRNGVYRCQTCVKASQEYRRKVSEAMCRNWENPEFRQSAVATRNTAEYIDNAARNAKVLWGNDEYKAKIAAYNLSPEAKAKRSKISKTLWQSECRFKLLPDDARRAKIGMSVSAKWEDTIFRDRMLAIFSSPELSLLKSRNARKQWQDEAYRALMYELYKSDDYRRKKSEISKELWATPGFREKVLSAMSNQEVISRMSEASRRAWEREDYRRRMIDVAVSQRMRISSIQLQLYRYLDDLGVDYYPEGPKTQIGHYLFDCLIPATSGKNLLIECQGDYWHRLPRAVNNDRSKFTYVDRYFPEHEIMYVWEHEFAADGRVLDRLKSKLGIELETVNFNFRDVVLQECEPDDYRSFLDAYHYIGKGRGGKCFGAYIDDKLVACCVFSPPVRQNLNDKFGDFVELSRFCIHPCYHKKNFATWLIAKFIKCANVKRVVAYADTTAGHTGVIYRAANFKFSHEVAPDYWYLDINNYVVRKKKLYAMARKMRMTESEYADMFGFVKKWGGKKLCFIYD